MSVVKLSKTGTEALVLREDSTCFAVECVNNSSQYPNPIYNPSILLVNAELVCGMGNTMHFINNH